MHLHQQEGWKQCGIATAIPFVAFCAFYTRQTYAFLPVYAAVVIFRRYPQLRMWCMASTIVAALPALYLLKIWHGFTPVAFQQHHQGFALEQISVPPAMCAFCLLPLLANPRTPYG